jgi:hypothetical protein
LQALLRQQREILLRTDPAAVAELERGTREIGRAMDALAALARQAPHAFAGFEAAAFARLQGELQANQAMLASLAAGNRRALNALFGEPALYSK